MRPGFAGLIGLVVLVLAGGVVAQTLGMASEPQALAKAALGSEAGSASVAVWRDGSLRVADLRQGLDSGTVASPGAGQAPPLYEIGSISKVFTGLLLAQAVERGELKLQDTLGSLLRDKVKFSSSNTAAITLEQLITHRSCLPRQFGEVRGAAIGAQIRGADRAALWAALANQELAQVGPCSGRYSNYGVAVVGEVLAEHYGKPWDQLVRDNITGPLGLADTVQHMGDKAQRLQPAFDGRNTTRPWDMQAFAGAGGLRSSVHDLALFGRAILAGRAGPLGAAAERLVTPLAPFQGGAIGYAVAISGPPSRRTYGHDGLTGGYRALLSMMPDTGEVLAALVSNGQAPLPDMGREVMASRYPVSGDAVELDANKLASYTGIFRVDAELAFTLVVANARLYVRSTGSGFRPYMPVGVDTFTRPAGGAKMTFSRSGAELVGFRLEQGGRVRDAQRTTERVPAPAVLDPEQAKAYAGRYQAKRLFRSPIEFDVTAQDGQLGVRSSAFAREPVFPVAGQPDRFRYEGVPAELQFERDASGAIVALVLHQNGELRAVRATGGP